MARKLSDSIAKHLKYPIWVVIWINLRLLCSYWNEITVAYTLTQHAIALALALSLNKQKHAYQAYRRMVCGRMLYSQESKTLIRSSIK